MNYVDANHVNYTIEGLLTMAIGWLVKDRHEVKQANKKERDEHAIAMADCQKNVKAMAEITKDIIKELEQARDLTKTIYTDASINKKG